MSPTQAPKFQVVTAAEADSAIDSLSLEDSQTALAFLDGILPNIVRRSAISKGTTPLGTLFTFQSKNVIFTCLNGHNIDGARVMVVLGIGAVVS